MVKNKASTDISSIRSQLADEEKLVRQYEEELAQCKQAHEDELKQNKRCHDDELTTMCHEYENKLLFLMTQLAAKDDDTHSLDENIRQRLKFQVSESLLRLNGYAPQIYIFFY